MQGISSAEILVGVVAVLSGGTALVLALLDVAPTDRFSTFIGMSQPQQRARWLLVGIGSLLLGTIIILHGTGYF